MKRISDHSRARFTANPELAFQARYGICGRAASLRMLTKNSLMFAPGDFGNSPSMPAPGFFDDFTD